MIYLTSLALILYVSGVFINKEITHVGQVLLIIPILKCLWVSFKEKTLALPKSAYWLMGFIFVAFLSIWLNSDLIERPSKLWYSLRAPIFGVQLIYVFRYWFKNSSDLVKKCTLNGLFFFLNISSLYGIYRFITLDQIRLEGFIHIMKQGYGSALILSLIIPAIIHRKRIKPFFSSTFAAFTGIILFIALFLTYTRGAMLGLVCSMPLTIYFYKKKLGLYLCGVVFILLSGLGGYYLFGNKNTDIRFLITKNNHSDAQRRSVWLAGLYALKERPLQGWGYMNFENHMKSVKERFDLPEKKFSNTHTHNNFLEVAVGTGVFGLLAFLGWLIFWCRETLKGHSLVKIFTLPIITVFVIAGQFELMLDHRLSIIIFSFYSLASSVED